MNAFAVSDALHKLIDKPVAEMTDDELTLWLMACEVMARRVNAATTRRDWKVSRAETNAEIARRNTCGAAAH